MRPNDSYIITRRIFLYLTLKQKYFLFQNRAYKQSSLKLLLILGTLHFQQDLLAYNQ